MPMTKREVGSVTIFDIKGDFVLTTVEGIGLYRSVKEALGAGKKHFLANLEGVSFMDSTGFGELFRSTLSIRNEGGEIKILKVPPKIRLIFKITGVERIYEFFEDEEEAIASFG